MTELHVHGILHSVTLSLLSPGALKPQGQALTDGFGKTLLSISLCSGKAEGHFRGEGLDRVMQSMHLAYFSPSIFIDE